MNEPRDRRNGNGHSVAIWAGVTACLANLAAVKIVTFINADNAVGTAIGVVVTSLLIGGSVYAKERLNEAKQAREDQAKMRQPEG